MITTLTNRVKARLRQTPLRKALSFLRHRGLRLEDAFIASYPRSGNTWMRFMLFELLSEREANFDILSSLLPELGDHRGAPAPLPGGGRLIKTHEPFHPSYNKALYLVRDPRDVALSEYRYWRMQRTYSGTFSDFLVDFVQGRTSGYGSWGEHVQSWLESPLQARTKLFLLTFESLRENPEVVLTEISEFLGLSVSVQQIDQAIHTSSIDAMRRKEQELRHSYFSNRDPFFNTVNRGAVGGWKEFLTRAEARTLESAFSSPMNDLGYL